MIPITDALGIFNVSSVGRYLIVTLVFVLAIRLLFGNR